MHYTVKIQTTIYKYLLINKYMSKAIQCSNAFKMHLLTYILFNMHDVDEECSFLCLFSSCICQELRCFLKLLVVTKKCWRCKILIRNEFQKLKHQIFTISAFNVTGCYSNEGNKVV